MAQVIRRNLEALRDRVTLIEDGSEIVPGIRTIAPPGHTVGHLAVSVASASLSLLQVPALHICKIHWRIEVDRSVESRHLRTQSYRDPIVPQEQVRPRLSDTFLR